MRPTANLAWKGTIPAYTEPIQSRRRLLPQDENNPRTRGANCVVALSTVTRWELSPHTRSKWRLWCEQARTRRTIPAYAEQMALLRPASTLARNYPRTRGANFFGTGHDVLHWELSPHTRSKCRQTRTKLLKIAEDDSDTASLLLRKLAERQRNIDFKRTLVFFLRLNNFKSTS